MRIPSTSCRNAASIWMASSRVGLRMRTLIALLRGTAARASIIGIGNDKFVLIEVVPQCGAKIEFREMLHRLYSDLPGGLSRAWRRGQAMPVRQTALATIHRFENVLTTSVHRASAVATFA